ncbi:uncharacterized protein BDW70DRAFT_164986 [Aspergillus foveolatus]|uniref:uncharacterized protein n=1 Tax=Aspergillus foveolatus TaxID=210207 RepID=UPI003CCDD61B
MSYSPTVKLAILRLINAITDRPGWHRAIFDQHVTAQWREEAIASASLINDKTWGWCLQELQGKARQFERDGRLVVFNTDSGVCKSDTTISAALKSQLSNLVERLSHQAVRQKSEAGVMNIVDPSLSSCLWENKIIERRTIIVSDRPHVVQGGANWTLKAGGSIWSSKFQWLPSEVKFTGPPGSTNVHISSYINNLHPTNREMYSVIEAVISGSIKQWNEILWKAQFPEWAKKLPPKEEEGKLSAEEYEAMCAQVETYLQEPESTDPVHWHRVRTQRIPRDWKNRWGLLRTALTSSTRLHCEQGLQVVVRLHSIELNPEMPSFPGADWHIEGNANERIVVNAVYAFDMVNMAEPQISFRQRCVKSGPTWVYDRISAIDSDADPDKPDDIYMKNALWDLKYMGRLFGVEDIQYSPGWQQPGEVTMPAGRLISFPNAFQRRMGPVQL